MTKKQAAPPQSPRPAPPADLLQEAREHTLPAVDILGWVTETFLQEGAPLYNEEHKHLLDADIGFLWTNVANRRQMRRIVGYAEQPNFRGNAWSKSRQEQQLREWFGCIPDFVITLDASFCDQASDVEFCALVEHELFHCAQARDLFDCPKFREDGKPVFTMRGHDVEEFIGIVRRYGAHGAVADLVAAASHAPEVSGINIARACGTCNLRAAS